MTFRISSKWLIISLFLISETILVLLYSTQDDRNRRTIAFGGTVLGAAFAFYTFLQGLDERRTMNAHHFIERWTQPDMENIRRVLLAVFEGRTFPASLLRSDPKAHEERFALVGALNFLEAMSLAVLSGTANEDLVKRFYGSVVEQSYAKLEDWIKNERRLDNEPREYCEFEKLVARWAGD